MTPEIKRRVTRHRDGTVSIHCTKGEADRIHFALTASAHRAHERGERDLAADESKLAHEILDGTWAT